MKHRVHSTAGGLSTLLVLISLGLPLIFLIFDEIEDRRAYNLVLSRCTNDTVFEVIDKEGLKNATRSWNLNKGPDSVLRANRAQWYADQSARQIKRSTTTYSYKGGPVLKVRDLAYNSSSILNSVFYSRESFTCSWNLYKAGGLLPRVMYDGTQVVL